MPTLNDITPFPCHVLFYIFYHRPHCALFCSPGQKPCFVSEEICRFSAKDIKKEEISSSFSFSFCYCFSSHGVDFLCFSASSYLITLTVSCTGTSTLHQILIQVRLSRYLLYFFFFGTSSASLPRVDQFDASRRLTSHLISGISASNLSLIHI